MNKQMLGLIMGIVLISLVGAYDLVAGEPYSIDLNETYEYYSIVGNYSQINLEVTQNGTIATIVMNKYSQPNKFELIFFNQEEKVITKYVSSGGGTKYVDKEVLVEVPNYIDRETVKEIEVEIEVEGETIVDKKFPVLLNIIYGFIIILLFMGLLKSVRRYRELKESIKEGEEND